MEVSVDWGCACTLRMHVSLYFDGNIKDPSRE